MAVLRKSCIATRLKELDDYYLSLRKALEGRAPDDFFASVYGFEKSNFIEECAQVNYEDVLIKLDHFKVEVTAMKTLKAKILKPKKLLV